MHLEKKEEAEEAWKGTLFGAQLQMRSWKEVPHSRMPVRGLHSKGDPCQSMDILVGKLC